MKAWRDLSPSNRAFVLFVVLGAAGLLLLHPALPLLFLACVALLLSVGLSRQGRGGDGGA